MKKRLPYRYIATSVEGFVQQLAVSYIGRGYVFYVTGEIPSRKDPTATDRKILEQYGIDISKWARARRTKAGLTSVHYLRFERFFIVIANEGGHRFKEEEKGMRDVRRDPVHFKGYSIGYKRDPAGKWHPSVRIHPNAYSKLKKDFLAVATKRSVESLLAEFQRIPFEAYAPVRVQTLCILRAVNRARKIARLEPISQAMLPLWRRPTKVFANAPPDT